MTFKTQLESLWLKEQECFSVWKTGKRGGHLICKQQETAVVFLQRQFKS